MLKFEVLSLLQDGSALTGHDAASIHSLGTMSIYQCSDLLQKRLHFTCADYREGLIYV